MVLLLGMYLGYCLVTLALILCAGRYVFGAFALKLWEMYGG